MLKQLKQVTLSTLKTSGAFHLVDRSRWRHRRLLILAYHGISLEDEHLWDYTQVMSPEVFRTRMELLKKSGCTVLPFAEALKRLYSDDLPEKSVSITFDDGTYDFYAQAYPILREFDYPVTLYLTTFYTHFNRPVFDVICSYLLWKGRSLPLDLNPITGRDAQVSLASDGPRARALDDIRSFARGRKLSAEEKDRLVELLADQLKIDYDALLAKRILHLLKPEEVKRLAEGGVDVQLHTHRHRTPLDRGLFLREIEDNRRSIREMTGSNASHFCYPSGVYNPAFLPWLKEAGIRSATTCDLGLASRNSNPLLLPRFLDVSSLSPVEFAGWLSGVSAALPQRRGTDKVVGY